MPPNQPEHRQAEPLEKGRKRYTDRMIRQMSKLEEQKRVWSYGHRWSVYLTQVDVCKHAQYPCSVPMKVSGHQDERGG